MLTLTLSWVLLALSSGALGDQEPLSGYGSNNLNALTVQDMFAADQYLGGFGPRAWSAERYVGLTTFGHAQPARCWGSEKDAKFDIAIVGAPFDTGTSYRPGTRFGPNGIRQGSRRIPLWALNVAWKLAVADHADILDCGDVPMIPFDNKVALRQLQVANADLLRRNASRSEGKSLAKDGIFHPRVMTLGGDHTITLPLLRGIHEIYGPVSVIHFDSHIDTWAPRNISGGPWLPGEEIPVNHGSYFWYAAKEGLLASNQANIHVGIRGGLNNWDDYENDKEVGFVISHAEDIEEVGYRGIVKRIREVVGQNPVYITFDIDVVDPGQAPATGTPEPGGFTTREIKKILQGLDGLKVVGADIVEVAPAYDTQDEITSIAAANIVWDLLALMAKNPLTA